MSLSPARLCGNLIVGGFEGTALPDRYARALRDGLRGGAVLFRRNVEGGPLQTAALARQIHRVSPEPLLAVDQEGGRVARLRDPLLRVPPMRIVAGWKDLGLAERIAEAVGAELAALGFTFNFAPVLDVDTCPDNPIIGDRSFSADPEVCSAFGAAWIRGLHRAGLVATGKHFPGHGDTSADSHVTLPTVARPLERLREVELAPFRAALAAGARALMTAHVVYPAIDPDNPATLSRQVCRVLREDLGFDGLLVSDDLEMRAVTSLLDVGPAAVQAVAAGCDALLICEGEPHQEAALDALVAEAERSPTFRWRCEQALRRMRAARASTRSRPQSDHDVVQIVGGLRSQAVAQEITRRLHRLY